MSCNWWPLNVHSETADWKRLTFYTSYWLSMRGKLQEPLSLLPNETSMKHQTRRRHQLYKAQCSTFLIKIPATDWHAYIARMFQKSMPQTNLHTQTFLSVLHGDSFLACSYSKQLLTTATRGGARISLLSYCNQPITGTRPKALTVQSDSLAAAT